MELGGWLRSLGLGKYEAAFRENQLDETVLPSLTAEDLKDLGVTIIGRHRRRTNWLAGILGCALSVAWAPESVPAQGIFDFLFGNSQAHDAAPIHPPPPAERPGRIAPPPLGPENVNEGSGSTGRGVAFCVRLCDGHQFPLEKIVKGGAAETCRANCPFSKTKVFFGTEISKAVAPDGQHYSNLDTAFLYRRQIIANCTCNGKNVFGLAPFDIRNDPTLHTGDLISTNNGLVAYTGNSAQGPILTPVNAATLPFGTLACIRATEGRCIATAKKQTE